MAPSYQFAACAFLSLAAARDITFPPVYGIAGQQILDQRGSIDVTGATFAGLSTYANIPYVHCLASKDEVEKFDIAILGAPFDTVSAVFQFVFTQYTSFVQEFVSVTISGERMGGMVQTARRAAVLHGKSRKCNSYGSLCSEGATEARATGHCKERYSYLVRSSR